MLLGKFQRLEGGVFFPIDHPSPRNVARLDMGALPLIDRMHHNGIYLDVAKCRKLHDDLGVQQLVLGELIDTIAGRPLNPGSGDQVARVLYDDLGLHKLLKEKSGQEIGRTGSGARLSSDDEALSMLKGLRDGEGNTLDPLPGLILDWREVAKIRSTYTGPLPSKVNPHTNRIHTVFNPVRTATGRLASSNPNCQNIPIRSALGKAIRDCFMVQNQNHRLVSGDLSQIEMVGAAHASNDPKMRKVFLDGLDLHTFTAISMFRLNESEIEPDPEKYPGAVCPFPGGGWPISWKVFKHKYRLPAKTLGFGILYGVTPSGLQLQILNAGGPYWSEDDCALFIRGWYALYQGVYEWTCEQHGRARRYGKVWDLLGRWRLIPEVHSSIEGVVNAGLRQAGNMPIQSLAQGIIKLAMATMERVCQYYEAKGVTCWPLLQIHDELIFEVEDTIVEEFVTTMKKVMRGVVDLSVPIGSSADVAMSWGELK